MESFYLNENSRLTSPRPLDVLNENNDLNFEISTKWFHTAQGFHKDLSIAKFVVEILECNIAIYG